MDTTLQGSSRAAQAQTDNHNSDQGRESRLASGETLLANRQFLHRNAFSALDELEDTTIEWSPPTAGISSDKPAEVDGAEQESPDIPSDITVECVQKYSNSLVDPLGPKHDYVSLPNVPFLHDINNSSRRDRSPERMDFLGPTHDYVGLPNVPFLHDVNNLATMDDFIAGMDFDPDQPLDQSDHSLGFFGTAGFPVPQYSTANVEFLARDRIVPQSTFPPWTADRHGAESESKLLKANSPTTYTQIANNNPFANVQFLGSNVSTIYASIGQRSNTYDVASAVTGAANSLETQSNHEVDSIHKVFQYSPLPKDRPGSVRLIRFVSNQSKSVDSNDIHLEMTTADPLLDQVNYVCLSYCWGEGGKDHKIYIKDVEQCEDAYRPLAITENLLHALRSLYSSWSYSAAWFWIDMVAINQDDLHERSKQVAMMKDIYKSATSVVIWLGDSEAAQNAYSVIELIYNTFLIKANLAAGSIMGPEGLKVNQQHLDLLKTYTSNELLGTDSMSAYEGVTQFFSLPWFRRVWVLQEAYSRRTVIVRVGAHTIAFEAVILAALWQSFLTRSYTSSSNAVLNRARTMRGYLPELWLDLLHTREPRGLSMMELVCRARDFEASDPRDKVFALLGLANDIPTSFGALPIYLQPNYDKPKDLVYKEFAKGMIADSGNLDVLSAVNTFTLRGIADAATSWMPNFDVAIATIRGLGFPKKYNAAFDTKHPNSLPIGSYADDTLSLSGFIIDTVGPVISTLITLSPQLHLQMEEEVNAVTNLWTRFFAKSPTLDDAKKSDVLQAFINTLTAAGFAFSRSFPEYPLGQIQPPQNVGWITYDFAAYWARTDPTFSLLDLPDTAPFTEYAKIGDADQFAVLSGKACHERKFFFTGNSRMGLCPRNAKEGDKIVILYGGSVPYVLRPTERDTWKFLGECYVDGIMFGEAESIKQELKIEDQTFHIT